MEVKSEKLKIKSDVGMSWKKVKLDILCKMNSGGTPSRKNLSFYSGDIPWAKISDIEAAEGGIVLNTEEYITNSGLAAINNRIFEKGTLLLAMYGSVGKVAFTGKKMSTNQAILGINIKDVNILDYSYLKYWFQTIKSQLLDRAVGGTLQNISLGIVKELEIPLPPLATQKRIAEILDAADALRRKDQELLKKYDELAQAIFIDMFGDPVKNEKGWEVKKLEEVCSKITDGEHGTVSRIASGKPYIMARNIRDGYIDFTETDYISEADHKRIFKRCNPEKGDLFLVCVGATIGRVCLMNSNDEYSLARSVALIKPIKKSINSKFLFSIFKSDFIQLQLKAANNSSAQAGLYTGKIKNLNIIVPPISVQNEFETRLNFISEQLQCIDLFKSDAIFKSLIQKAFRGELVQ